jgi:hypothetical protein
MFYVYKEWLLPANNKKNHGIFPQGKYSFIGGLQCMFYVTKEKYRMGLSVHNQYNAINL